jgi:L-asparaginase / beta-aspartyl-peptidase
MKNLLRLLPVGWLLLVLACASPSPHPPAPVRADYALAIHGGAGTISRQKLSPEKEAAYRAALDSALTIGETILKNGGTALDAVTQTVIFLENCPFFNAGRGAVFTHEGKNELDASIMDGLTQKAGSVGGVTTIKNPILLARAVMDKSPHVLLTGRGAEQFADENGLERADAKWFFTPERWQTLQEVQAEERAKSGAQGSILEDFDPNPDKKFGTVGCVALDRQGNIAAGTSTGGMTNKRWNRLGDTPVIGAGTYADNAVCGVSCTGHGEFFIRYAVAHDVWALMSYKNLSLADATAEVVNRKLVEKGGEGGLIAVDKWGNVALPFNSEGMYRGYAKPGERRVDIWK